MDIVLVVILAVVIIQFIAMLSLFSKNRHSLQVEVAEFMRRLERNETALLDEFGKNKEETSKSVKDSMEELSSNLKSVSEQLPTILPSFTGLVDNKMKDVQVFMDSGLKSNREELLTYLKEFEEKFSAKIEALTKDTNDKIEKTRSSIEKVADTQQGNGKKLDDITQTMDAGLIAHREELLTSQKAFEVKSLTRIEALAKNTSDGLEKNRESIEKELADMQQGNEKKLDEITQAMDSSLKYYREGLSISLKGFEDKFSAKIEALGGTIEKKLLDGVTQIVDEKLHKTLETRFDKSFKLLSDKLELVQKGLGETKTLANEVGSVKDVLSKTKEKLNIALSEIENADTQTREIERKLRDVQTLPEELPAENTAVAPAAEEIAAPAAEEIAAPAAEEIAAPVAEEIAEPVAEEIAAPVAEEVAVPVAEEIAAPVAEENVVVAAAEHVDDAEKILAEP